MKKKQILKAFDTYLKDSKANGYTATSAAKKALEAAGLQRGKRVVIKHPKLGNTVLYHGTVQGEYYISYYSETATNMQYPSLAVQKMV